MKKQVFFIMSLMAVFYSCKKESLPAEQNAKNGSSLAVNQAASTPYKVAYYAFDNGGPRLIDFAREANVVVLFEAHEWRFVDSAKYTGNDFIFGNKNYKTYGAIMADVRILQRRGVKVLMNEDDNAGWSTNTPFTDYSGKKLNNTQFISMAKSYILDSLHLDGIALDIEHGAKNNANYKALLTGLGQYFGPLSKNPNSLYIAAIYSGAPEGGAIGKDANIAKYVNFVEDMGYFSDNTSRFNQWADIIGASKTMIGVSAESNFKNLTKDVAAAKWQPVNGKKAGIMVYAANLDSTYTNTVFKALTN